MKVFALLLLLLIVSCSRPGYSVVTDGEPSGIRFENDSLTFCDKRGGRRLDLKTGHESHVGRTCPDHQDANPSCSGLNFDVVVRAPLAEPNDILDLNGSSVPLKGRVHDCAYDGKVLAIVTASVVVLIDTRKESTKEISLEGGDHVIMASGWIAWSNGAQIRVVAREVT